MDLSKNRIKEIGGTLMDNIVAHSLEKLYTELINIDQIFLDSDLKDMDAYEKDLATAFRCAVAEHMQSMYNSLVNNPVSMSLLSGD